MTNDTNTTSMLLKKLYDWWVAPTGVDTTSFLDSRLAYDRGYGGLDGQDWVWWVGQKPPWRDVRIVGRVVDETSGALVFEGVDSATELRHRVAWLVDVNDGRVTRVVETNSPVG
jgi:hypothetical protein